MSISIRVIDGVYGRAASGLLVTVRREVNDAIVEGWNHQTGDDGSVSDLIGSSQARGSYIVELDFNSYFSTLGYASFFSAVITRFRVVNETRHYELSITITPTSCFALKID